MPQSQESTRIKDLKSLLDLRGKGLKDYEIAEEMGVDKSTISHLSTFQHQCDEGRLAPMLIKVIRLHNDLPDASYGEKKRLFTLNKVHGRNGLYSGKGPPRYTVEQQAAALQKTLECVRRKHPGWIRPEVETIEECEDWELRSLDWVTFMRELKKLSE